MIIFPMCGQSRRFSEAGYGSPKFMLPIWDGYCFDYAVLSFSGVISQTPVLFIIPENNLIIDFLNDRCRHLGIHNFEIVTLPTPTLGQADTVEKGLNKLGYNDELEITIFNIDTFRIGYKFPEQIHLWDGYLEVFIGSGKNWSFIEPDNMNSTRVIRTSEKKPISNLCSTGLYYFRQVKDFKEALAYERGSVRYLSELYIAPIYNHMIDLGRNIHFHIIDREEVIFCGNPDEYEKIKLTPQPSWWSED